MCARAVQGGNPKIPFALFICNKDLIRQLGGAAAARKEERRLLGLDVGDKYVGLALSDLDNKIASPFSVLLRKKSNLNLTLMASDFDSLISLYSLKGFVIGIPWDRHRVSSNVQYFSFYLFNFSLSLSL
ncbi:hypothetical protein RIF29_21311 [Crotalaria pallida]|uniref:YqgF/RNase H-like domain-containing protein n=1 Tax=Crotalaria pallida TaxID=3830 RepID=A0AAN9F4H9_CROPI